MFQIDQVMIEDIQLIQKSYKKILDGDPSTPFQRALKSQLNGILIIKNG